MTRSPIRPHRRFARSSALVSLLATAAIALSGCVFLPSLAAGSSGVDDGTGGDADPSDSPTESDVHSWDDVEAMLSEPMSPSWSQEEYLPVGGATLTTIGDTVLAYVQTDDRPLALASFDVTTGDLRWIQDAGVNSVESSGLLRPVLIADGDDEPMVALLAPPHAEGTDLWAASLMLLDVHTGDPIAGFDTMWIWSYWECGLDRTICFWGSPPSSEDAELFTFSADDGVIPYTDTFDEFELTRTVWNDLWAVVDDAGDEWLVHRDGDDEIWRLAAAEIVGDGTLVDGLLGAQTVEDDEILLLNVHPVYAEPPYESSADDYVTVGIDAASGQLLWQLEGYLGCSADVEHPVLCSGDLSYSQQDSASPVMIEAGAVDLHGVDPRTGDLLWTHEFAHMTSVSPHVDRALLSFGDVWAGQDGGKISLTHRATGEVYEFDADEVIGCQVAVTAQVPEFTIPEYDDITIQMGSSSAVCTDTAISHDIADFTRAAVYGTGSFAWSPDAWIESAESGITVVQTRDGFYGFDVR